MRSPTVKSAAPRVSAGSSQLPEWPLVSVVVVNYNGGERLGRCLETLQASSYPASEVLVVDNASTDGSAAAAESVAARSANISFIKSSRNLGYSGGVNLALDLAQGAYIAVLNMDVTVEPGWLEPLVTFLEAKQEAGGVNPLIVLDDCRGVNAVGQDVHITGLGFNRGLGWSVARVGRSPVRISGLHGAAFVVRRETLERVGGMDSSGFLYHEDVNLSWLLALMGYELYCVPSAVVRHDYFLSMYADKLHLLERNRWAMLLAYVRWPTLLSLSPALLLTEALVWAYCLLRGGAFAKAKLESYRWLFGKWPEIRRRARLARSLRVVSDWTVLRRLRWAYTWSQLMTLGRERGSSRRQPFGGLPTDAIEGWDWRQARLG